VGQVPSFTIDRFTVGQRYELAQVVRRVRQKDALRLPAMTCDGQVSDREKALKAGF